MKRWFEQLWSKEKRRAERLPSPPLVVYYWDGARPEAREVRDISMTGMYLKTEESWYPNTLIRMTVVNANRDKSDPDRSIEVTSRMVRAEDDGVGLAFILSKGNQGYAPTGTFPPGADARTLSGFLAKIAAPEPALPEPTPVRGGVRALSEQEC